MRAFPDERDEVPTRGRLRGRFPELDSRSDGSLRVEERTDMGERYLVDMTTGEKIIPGSRRPDGTYRKEIRVRAGYVPLEERRTFQTRQQLSRNERQVPGAGNIPGFSPSAFPPGYSGIASPSGNGKRAPARKGEKKHGEKTPEEKTPAAKGKRCGDAETPNAREADDLCRDMQKLSVGVQEKDTPVSETDSLKKRVRNVKKKLKEIEALQQKVDAGQTLGAEQMGKLQRKKELDAEVLDLERRLAELEKN
ncbi:mago binding protein [Toxoplasma gondii ME49]|uniref:Mago binding protein n=17 Tax=Toxoplasma gondii TaxID=5811 RepID=B9PK30_TOXGV|nr:mago binding protein [Toxoplasma gondii ME49]EPR61085.1 mago binding protein [Toxoplasma gondii GT1]ESS34995.1 mago binding protein [Toxoplasma gondii VEG]KAF4639340.1 mago binding protein [Toxoplasma gondii]KFG44273.1 mago binding protein [Toxoplasma gondii GAB2-2007-GAL-DOM2]KFG65939.1 mago binding protein [Toxoplasma gondii RUB]KFH09548.1 mago binding protein [Toxoplasma gondii VAND]KFH17964.1 mago binding protein [Toxoplasma gondii MAS]KYF47946.1 mago binding protein [Toxoplasma gond|eukprot:XP_002364407.1 mago binding protein [Toxoplasma gondii ME49]